MEYLHRDGVYLAKEASGILDSRGCPEWQPARNVETEGYSGMDLNPTHRKTLKGISFPNQTTWALSLANMFISAQTLNETTAVPHGLELINPKLKMQRPSICWTWMKQSNHMFKITLGDKDQKKKLLSETPYWGRDFFLPFKSSMKIQVFHIDRG